MSNVISTLPTSRRGYLSQSELEQFTNIEVVDVEEADDRINQAEEIIDAFAGPQRKFYTQVLTGRMSAVASASAFTLQSDHQNTWENDYFKYCEIEIIGGTGAGQRRSISASTKAGVITVQDAFTTAPTTTSIYRIYQLGKFPRYEDAYLDTYNTPNTWYKAIPEAIKRAVAAQIEYLIEMGDSFFKGDNTDKTSESIMNYSYTNKEGTVGAQKLIAPKARLLLRGFKRRVGVIVES